MTTLREPAIAPLSQTKGKSCMTLRQQVSSTRHSITIFVWTFGSGTTPLVCACKKNIRINYIMYIRSKGAAWLQLHAQACET
jgi:hypothetical protein